MAGSGSASSSALVALAVVRVALDGWAAVAPDDARYLYVGLSILHGQGPVDPSGSIYLARSPVYGLLLASGSVLLGGDPLAGARIVALALALLGLAVAVRLGWLLAGVGGAVGTAIALVATALVWRLAPSMRIDLAQTAAVVATLWAIWRPTTRRWALGGVLLGVSILIKETALPLLILPIALVGFVPNPRVIRLGAVFLGAAIATAAWWWIVVWVSSGQVFPLNALAVLEARDVAVPLRIGRSAAPLLAAAIVGWGLVAWRARHAPGATPAAGGRRRARAGRAVRREPRSECAQLRRSRGAVGGRHRGGRGVGRGRASERGAQPVGQPAAQSPPRSRWPRWRSSPSPRRSSASVTPAASCPITSSDDLAGWLAANVPEGGRVVMAFRERDAMALRRFGKGEVDLLPVTRVRATDPLEGYLWVGLRDRQLFGYPRAAWATALTEPVADALVLVGPHPFTPSDLAPDAGAAARLGLTLAATLDEGADRVEIYRVDAAAAIARTPDAATHLSVEAARAWLDLVGSDAAAARFLAARPVVTGSDVAIRELVRRLGTIACVDPRDRRAPSASSPPAPARTEPLRSRPERAVPSCTGLTPCPAPPNGGCHGAAARAILWAWIRPACAPDPPGVRQAWP